MEAIKSILLRIAVAIFKSIFGFAYFFLKKLPTDKDKVVFCSRQANEIPLDFKLIQEKLREHDEDIRCVYICRHIGENAVQYMIFVKELIRSMYHMATGRVCVINSYWPAVSLLKHKEQLTVIQIWHSIGKIKKSGYQTVGKTSGRKRQHAELLGMHKNYDYIIAGAKPWNGFYCESFGTDEDKLLNYGLPRVDYLLETEEANRRRFFDENPDCEGKRIILYAPTFRKNMESKWRDIGTLAEDEDNVLIVKGHPKWGKNETRDLNGARHFNKWETIDLLAVCDILITDYSAIALEGAVLNKKTYYWVYDYEQYAENNGLNFDLYKELGPHVYSDIEELSVAIKEERFDWKLYRRYREKYVLPVCGGSTDKIAALITAAMKGEA